MRIVVIDDNPADLGYFAKAMARIHGADVLALGSVAGNTERISEHQPIVVLLDDRLGPLLTAEHSLKTIADEIRALPTVVMSGDIGPARRAKLIRLGAIECVDKDHLDSGMLELIVAMAQQRDLLLKRAPRPAVAN